MSDNDLTMAQVCSRFAVKRWTIHRWMRDLSFPKGHIPIGRKGRRWSVDSVDFWEAQNDAINDARDPVTTP